MRQKVIKYVWLLGLLVTASCTNDKEVVEISNETQPMKAQNSCTKTRSVEDAKAIAADYFSQTMTNGTGKKGIMRIQAQPTVQILTTDSLPLRPGDLKPVERPDTLLYGITYSTGTIMVPAAEDAPTVVGVLDTPTESLATLIRANNGNNPLYELLKPICDPDIYRLFVQNLELDLLQFLKEVYHDPIIGGSEEDIRLEREKRKARETYVAPKIPVEWDQHEPFNLFCPNHYPAGCVAIAAGQAMTITGVPYKDGENYKDIWKFKNAQTMNDNSDLGYLVARLIHKIGENIDTEYSLNGSKAYTKNAIPLFQQIGMNVSNDIKDIKPTLRDYQDGVIIVQTKTKPTKSNPTSSIHCFLIDGYRYEVYYNDERVMIHVNLGWGPKYNGYFIQNLLCPSFYQSINPGLDNIGEWTYYCLYRNKIVYRYY